MFFSAKLIAVLPDKKYQLTYVYDSSFEKGKKWRSI